MVSVSFVGCQATNVVNRVWCNCLGVACKCFWLVCLLECIDWLLINCLSLPGGVPWLAFAVCRLPDLQEL